MFQYLDRIKINQNKFAKHKFSSILNCLLLQARFLIFRCKVSKNTPNMHMYFLLIKNVKLVERKIAQKHGK